MYCKEEIYTSVLVFVFENAWTIRQIFAGIKNSKIVDCAHVCDCEILSTYTAFTPLSKTCDFRQQIDKRISPSHNII